MAGLLASSAGAPLGPWAAALEQAERELRRASDTVSKVTALLAALGQIQEAQQGTVHYVSPTGAGPAAAALAADHLAMQWATAQIFQLAMENGVEDEFKETMEARHMQKLAQRWGSGIDGAPLAALSCANIDVATQHVCSSEAKHTCSNCRLVVYCSPQCQRQHWTTHRIDCQSTLADPGWLPRWIAERRRPSYVNEGPG